MIRRNKRGNDCGLSVLARRARKDIVIEVANTVKIAQDANPSSSGAMNIIYNKIKIYSWLTKDMVYGTLRRIKAAEKQTVHTSMPTTGRIDLFDPSYNIITATKGGRPKGSISKSIPSYESNLRKANNEYKTEKEKNGSSVNEDAFNIYSEFGITDPNLSVKAKSIKNQVNRNRRTNRRTVDLQENSTSPLQPIVPVLLHHVYVHFDNYDIAT
eukprot:CAMPEP_0198249460 /NCGR_PEP_ID=MMETSP1447-20131203/992_1 /TAXON_ID=420782 /ORGANISM="Chaetoceros dichaeta, Strain CCMP1751" /LENGTH=212 /DNA_ID=CAMNT_0043934105 /DNA_START=32 /DNA_END=670 /DNA_ORIENTATION=+